MRPVRVAWLEVVLVGVVALGAGCGPMGADEGTGRTDSAPQALGASTFSDTSPYCPPTDAWPGWGQTPLGTWDGDVQPSVQYVINTTNVHSTTYVGHDPSIGRASDWRPHSRTEGTQLANWFMQNARAGGAPLGIQYIIWQAQIFDIALASQGVRLMADRGSFTANHCDHVHTSFVLPAGSVQLNAAAVTSWGGPPMHFDCGLNPGGSLGAGQGLSSCDGRFQLLMQNDGNLVLYQSGGRALWSSQTNGKGGQTAIMQDDGNLVVYGRTGPLWWTNTQGNRGSALAIQNDGNLVVYAPGSRWTWQSGTPQ